MKIEFHYTYIIIALSFIITGYFSNLIVFTSIIIIHELGHYITAKLHSIEVNKIIIYPYGGLTQINSPINTKISIDLKIAISGIVFQLIYYFIIYILYKKNIIREYIFEEFTTYNFSILFFNILPIHPLDGSKILNLFLSKMLPYKLTLKLNIVVSLTTLIIIFYINYYQFNYTTILIITIILDNIVKYYKEINYIFNKFLLERYLNKKIYKKNKTISKIENMYKEKYHLIKNKNHYITEKQALKDRFYRK